MRNSAFWRWLKRNPLNLIGSVAVIVLAALLLLYANTKVTGLNTYELNSLKHLSSFGTIIRQPLDIFFYLIAKLLSFALKTQTALKITSFIFAIATLINVRYLIKYWYDERSANLGTLILGTSFWFISVGKGGSPGIMPAFWLTTILALSAWRKYTKLPKIATALLVVAIGLSIYTPYFVWVLISLALIIMKDVGPKTLLKKLLRPYGALSLLIIAPLIYSVIKEPIAKDLLGLYEAQLNPIRYLETFVSYLANIAVKAPLNPSINLGRLPLLNIFEVIMLALGVVTMYAYRNTLKGKATIVLPVAAIALLSLFKIDQTKLSALMPIIYILVTVGLSEFMQLWLKGFPRNPFGRSLGLLLCVALISLSGYYNIHKYFTAWANNPDVKAAHQLQ